MHCRHVRTSRSRAGWQVQRARGAARVGASGCSQVGAVSRRPWCRCAWAAPRSRRPAAVVAAMPAVEAPHASCRGARRRGALCVRVGRSRAGCARWVGARCARCVACSDRRASSNTAPRSPRLAVQMVPRRPPRGSDLRDQGADRADGAC